MPSPSALAKKPRRSEDSRSSSSRSDSAATAKKRTGKASKKLPAKVKSFFTEDEQKAIEDSVLSAVDEVPSLTIFGEEFKKLVKRSGADAGKLETDAVTASMYRATLAMILDLLPTAEAQYRLKNTENSAYALIALSNQAISVSNLLRGFTDLQDKAKHIEDIIVIPSFMRMAQQLLAAATGVYAVFDSLQLKPDQRGKAREAVADMVKSFAVYLQHESTAVTSAVGEFMGEGSQIAAGAPKLKAMKAPGAAKKAPAKKAASKKAAPKKANGKPSKPRAPNGTARRKRGGDREAFDYDSIIM